MRRISVLAGVTALVLAVTACEEQEAERVGTIEDADTDEPGPEPEPAPEDDTEGPFAVGDIVRLGDFDFVVHTVEDPFPTFDDFQAPAPGMRWIRVDAEITNNSDSPEHISSFLMVDVRDPDNRSYDPAFVIDIGPELQGEIPPGRSLRGFTVFEVPEGMTPLTLFFSGEVWAIGQAEILL